MFVPGIHKPVFGRAIRTVHAPAPVAALDRAAPERAAVTATDEVEVTEEVRLRAIAEIRKARDEMDAHGTIPEPMPLSVEKVSRNTRLRRSPEDIAHYAVAMAAAESRTREGGIGPDVI